jgi:SPP1 gp7 family putative phage head morphogenesis protein
VTTQQQQQQNQRIQTELAALILAGGAVGYVGIGAVTQLLSLLSPAVPIRLANWLATMTAGGNLPGDLLVPMGPAQLIEHDLAAAWLAMFLTISTERLTIAVAADATAPGAPPPNEYGRQTPGQAEERAREAEARYFQRHLYAEGRRLRSAALVDMAARLNGDREGLEQATLLGWRAVIDGRTTPECRQAHGKNFRADRIPDIGWPGAVHIHCRCSAGPAIPGAPLIPSP